MFTLTQLILLISSLFYQASGITIVSPQPGQAVQGSIPILVDTGVENFASAELTFSYADDPTRTWFYIASSTAPISGTKMAEWDTTTITDGNYNLRLVVVSKDSSRSTYIVKSLRVRNYTAVETETPTPQPPTITSAPGSPPPPTPSVTPTVTLTPILATPTSLPPNPAELNLPELGQGLLQGAAISVIAFCLFGLVVFVRKVTTKK